MTRMPKHALIALIASAFLSTFPAAGDDVSAIADAVAPSLVRVEYTLQYDKGEPPRDGGWSYRCPNCGDIHWTSGDEVIEEERPVERGGFLIAPDRVLTGDLMTHPRWIKSIAIRAGDELIPARPVEYATDQNAVVLQLDRPFAHATPLAFNPTLEGPYYTVTYGKGNGAWTLNVKPLAGSISLDDSGRRFRPVETEALIVNAAGAPVAACMREELPVDDSWKTAPSNWTLIPAAGMDSLLSNLESVAGAGVLRVTVNFRSPPQDEGRGMWMGNDDETATEWQGHGVLLDEKTVLVLGDFKPKVTARLERIRVYQADSDRAVAASFHGTLRDYGGFLATLEEPLTGGLRFAGGDIRNFRNRLLLGAEVIIQGEQRNDHYGRTRFIGFNTGWQRQLYPSIPGSNEGKFIFSTDGDLVAFPVSRRQKVSVEERWDYTGAMLTPASYFVHGSLTDWETSIDPANRPLSEAEQNRLAWFGIEMQGLDQELARINKVSDLTSDGQAGVLVTWVYEDSPAAVSGIQVGDILIRLHVEGHPKPFDVGGADLMYMFNEGFPWDQLDDVPEQFFDQIPTPWPSVDGTFHRRLTDLGFGTAFQAEVYRDGEQMDLDMAVIEGPDHYKSAPKFKSEPLGVTVRDLTYEVRRYFQKLVDEPGVVIAKIEMGSKASIAGIKPYEILTHINDEPVMSVADMERLIEGQTELRLNIKRMTRGRLVTIQIDPAPAPAPGDGEGDDGGDDG